MENLEKQALDIFEMMCQGGCTIADSGGKDSSVIKHLALKSRQLYGTNFKVRHNHTTVDAPETVRYVRNQKIIFESLGIEYEILFPKESMWQLIVRHKTPPTRLARYCCSELKENTGIGEKLVTGVRKAESNNRKNNQGIITFTKPKLDLKNEIQSNHDFFTTSKGGVVLLNLDNDESRRVVEQCYRTNKTLINPIINWSDDFLWWYIKKEKIDINPQYFGGCNRIGCIGCPMAGKNRYTEFEKYPKYKDLYIHAFDRMVLARKESGLKCIDKWKDGKSVFKWWMEDENIDGQLAFDEFGNIGEDY